MNNTNQASEEDQATRMGIHMAMLAKAENAKDCGGLTVIKLGFAVSIAKELIRTENLKLLDEVIHQSTVNLKSAKAVAGWAELRKEQLEANQ